jgi:hypothetical protein
MADAFSTMDDGKPTGSGFLVALNAHRPFSSVFRFAMRAPLMPSKPPFIHQQKFFLALSKCIRKVRNLRAARASHLIELSLTASSLITGGSAG